MNWGFKHILIDSLLKNRGVYSQRVSPTALRMQCPEHSGHAPPGQRGSVLPCSLGIPDSGLLTKSGQNPGDHHHDGKDCYCAQGHFAESPSRSLGPVRDQTGVNSTLGEKPTHIITEQNRKPAAREMPCPLSGGAAWISLSKFFF